MIQAMKKRTWNPEETDAGAHQIGKEVIFAEIEKGHPQL